MSDDMDPVTHVLITRKFISSKPGAIVAGGILPDIPFYAVYPAWVMRQGGLRLALADNKWPDPPLWLDRIHHALHSLPMILLLSVIFGKRLPRYIFAAWGLHVIVDIPTHSKKSWGPRFLWPLANVSVDGMSWVDVVIRMINK